MSKKGFAPIIIVLIIALLGIGGITGYSLIKNKQPNKETTTTTKEAITIPTITTTKLITTTTTIPSNLNYCIHNALSLGTISDEVTALQQGLKQDTDIYPEGLTDGYFGEPTEAAVKRFQEKYGIRVTGEVGPQTRTKFNNLYCDSTTTTTTIANCVNQNEEENITSTILCCPHLVKIEKGGGQFKCVNPNFIGLITGINLPLYQSLGVSASDESILQEVTVINMPSSDESIIDYTIQPPQSVAISKFIIGQKIEAWIETAVSGNYAHGINIISSPDQNESAKNCIDSDGGDNSNIKGTVTYNGQTYNDECFYYCSNTSYMYPNCLEVREYYCENGVALSKIYICDEGFTCKDGVCILSQ